MKNTVLLLFLLIQLTISAQTKPSIRETDRIRINEAFKINDSYAEKIWKGWSEIPFSILLVTDSTEFLIRHPKPSDDFKLLGYDSLLKSNIYFRNRVFNTNLLASFPAVNEVSTIVVGQPENTKKSSVGWIITLLHEHFHQLQVYQKDYYESVRGLDLAGGDKTGMWMLNFPFPYEKENVIAVYDSLKQTLLNAVNAGSSIERNKLVKNYLGLKEKFKDAVSNNDYKYFSFQLWQEGIARYTELKITRTLLDDNYKFSKAVSELSDFSDLKTFFNDYYNSVINEIKNKLNESKRVCFYAIGAGEGLLLDVENPDWKEQYFNSKFYLENYYK